MEIHKISIEPHVSLDSCCRTCMTASDNMRSIFYYNNEKGRPLSDLLSFVAEIEVQEDDLLPKQICEQCVANAQAACSFKELCQKTDSALKEVLKTEELQKTMSDRFKNKHFMAQSPMMIDITFDEPLVKSEDETDDVKMNGDIFHYDLSCRLCFKTFNTANELEEHSVQHNRLFQCTGCSYRCSTESALQKHIQSAHSASDAKVVTSELHKCDNCGESFILRKSYNNHKKKCVPQKTFKRSSRRIKKEVDSDNSLSESPENTTSVKGSSEVDSNEFKTESMSSVDRDDTETVDQDNTQPTLLHCCLGCGVTFKSERAYKIHLKRKHGSGLVKPAKRRLRATSSDLHCNCVSCLKEFTSLEELQMHVCDDKADSEDTKQVDPYPCTMCERKFLKKSSLDSHLKRHEQQANEVHTCVICKREFKRRAHLDNHMLTHSADQGFKCETCSKTFASIESLEVHASVHKASKKHQCSFCNKGFNMLSTLKDHIRTHTGEKPFLCSICGRGFSQGTNLKEHLRRHQGYKPFKCPDCPHTFVSKGELEAHLRKHSGAHPFVCDVCGSGFTTSSSLVKHKRIHTGERPYACDFCTMRFTALGTLKNHRRTHTGEKPYKCNYCVKAFVQKNDLVSHTRTHTGERPYVCATCGHAFRQSSALKTHLKMHGGTDGALIRPIDAGLAMARGDSTLSLSPVETLITMRSGDTILTLRQTDSTIETVPTNASITMRQDDTSISTEPMLTVLPLCKTSPIGIA